MKILYIHQYFNTPRDNGPNRSYWISQELIKDGHEVVMLTSNSKINSKIERKKVDDIDVIYLKMRYRQSMGVLKRLLTFVRFMIQSTRMALKEKNVDLVIATSTPLTIGFPALILKKFNRIPFLFEVRDLWPEVPIQMGALKNKLLIDLAEWFEKTIYQNAIHIVALSPGMYDGIIKRNIKSQKVSIIPNMSKIDFFWSREKNLVLTEKLGLQRHSFKVIYFGAMGIANGMDYIINSIKEIPEGEQIEFVFIGGGATEPLIRKKCKNNGIKNVHFLGGCPLKDLSEIVNLCDVCLITFADIPILATNSPNKLFDSLSAEKPIIVNSPGWTKKMVEEHHCGIFTDPKKPKDLSNKILWLKENPEICKEMGLNSRKLAETTYDKSILCRKFADIILKLDPRLKEKREG